MRPPGTWLAFKANQDLRENATLNKNHKRHQTMLWASVKLQSEAGPQSTEDISLLCFVRPFFAVL